MWMYVSTRSGDQFVRRWMCKHVLKTGVYDKYVSTDVYVSVYVSTDVYVSVYVCIIHVCMSYIRVRCPQMYM